MLKYYKHYFKALAIDLPELAHTEEEPAYFFIRDQYSPDAFDRALRQGVGKPALLLEPYSYKTKNNSNKNYFKHLEGRFSIMIKAADETDEAIEAAQEQAEAIADKLLATMRVSFEGGQEIVISPDDKSSRVFFDLDECPVDPVGPMDLRYYGVSVGFEWRTPQKAKP